MKNGRISFRSCSELNDSGERIKFHIGSTCSLSTYLRMIDKFSLLKTAEILFLQLRSSDHTRSVIQTTVPYPINL